MADNMLWLPILGYHGYYEVSDHGLVRGIDRKITLSNGNTRQIRCRIIITTWMKE